MTPSPLHKMPEAETSLRLAFYLLQSSLTDSVEVAIDGAQVKTLEQVHFAIDAFLAGAQCHCTAPKIEWRGLYVHQPTGGRINIHSGSGRGDVVALLRGGRTFRAESKKGLLVPSANSREYPLLREALGQLLTLKEVAQNDLLAVAVPQSAKFADLAAQWRVAPLIQRAGIQILTVNRDNQVRGLQLS